jgi:hypothetical protein
MNNKTKQPRKTGLFCFCLSFFWGDENTLSFFLALASCVSKKMKVCFVRWSGRAFFTNLFFEA